MDTTISDMIDANFSQYPKVEYSKGEILVFAREDPGYIFYITEGRVRKYGVTYRGDEAIINIFQPPAFFPMSWVLNRTPNQFFYKAETNVTVHTVPCENALAFIQENPNVALDLLARVYRGSEGMYGRMLHLMSHSARNRLLYELVIECRRFGVHQKDGSYLVQVSAADLAARSGLTRETISREIRTFKVSKMLSLNRGKITIYDIEKLESLAGF